MRTRKTIAWFTRFLAPLFGHWALNGCVCCGIHEAVTPKHTVWNNEGSGSSILCEGCWHDLSTPEKLRYYRIAYEKWWADGRDWKEYEMAIRYPYHWRNKSGVFLTFEEA